MIATLLVLPLALAQEPTSASAPPVAPPPAPEVPASSVAVEIRLSDGQTLSGWRGATGRPAYYPCVKGCPTPARQLRRGPSWLCLRAGIEQPLT